MFERILVALDGSAHASAALECAFVLAANGRRSLTCCAAIDSRFVLAESYAGIGFAAESTSMLDALRAQATALLSDASARAHAHGRALATQAIVDAPVAAIVGAAHGCDADLIVMGTGGRTAVDRFVLGSTTEGVLRACAIPVLTVRADAARNGLPAVPFTRALVAIDDSGPADAAAALAVAFATEDGLRLNFCTVAATTDLREKALAFGYDPMPMFAEIKREADDLVSGAHDRALGNGVESDTTVMDGKPANEILRAATTTGAHLIVIGSHGRRGLRRLFLGSVAEAIVRAAEVAVLVVRDSPF